MTALVNHFTYEFKSGLRSTTSLLMNYLFPLGFYAMMGLVMTQVNPQFVDTMIPAMVLVSAMAATLLGMPSPLVESRDAGIYRSFKINGVPAGAILLMPALTTIFHVLIVTVIISLTANPFFKGVVPENWWAFSLVTLVSVVACGGIGSLIGVVAGEARAVVLFSQLIFLPSMLVGGVMLPLDTLPESVRRISLLLPSSHAMQAYAGYAYGQPTVISPLIALLVLAASGAIAFALAVYLFNWDNKNETRRGHPLMGLLALVPYAISIFLVS